jgi:ABC-type sugar transport system ATPase subunit
MRELAMPARGIAVAGLEKRFGSTTVFEGIGLDVRPGEYMVIVGPSGCGKSTLLRVVAGVERADRGSVRLGERDITHAHPGDRDLAMVFQDYALYPHMSVADNLSFGLRAQHVPKREIRERVELTSRLLGIHELLPKKPGQLSGGQRQRVALGRAMIREPSAYLMDEPLSNLDAALRVQMRGELIDFHRRTNGTVLYVTHDQVEAMTMGDRVAVMNRGRFEQIGPPHEVYERPANVFVATFLGSPRMNVVAAEASSGPDGATDIVAGDLRWSIPTGALPAGLPRRVQVGFRPEALALAGAEPDSVVASPALFRRRVAFTEHLGNEVIVHLEAASERTGLVGRVSPDAARALGPESDLSVSPAHIHIFDEAGAAVWHGSVLRSAAPAITSDT